MNFIRPKNNTLEESFEFQYQLFSLSYKLLKIEISSKCNLELAVLSAYDEAKLKGHNLYQEIIIYELLSIKFN